jgi:hypothetical protein
VYYQIGTNAFFNRKGREDGEQKTEDGGQRMEKSEKRMANNDLCAFLLCPIVSIMVKIFTAKTQRRKEDFTFLSPYKSQFIPSTTNV